MHRALVVLLPLAVSSAGAAFAPALPIGEAPPQLADAVRRADAAARTLQARLSARLAEAMRQGGPAGAVSVCRDEAARLTSEAARDSGTRIGRTSDRLRNPANAAPAWAATQVAAAAGKRAAEVRALVFDLGAEVGVLRPIAVAQPCLRCHGPAASIPPEVAEVLRGAYPGDRATGYAEGDHRGFVWVVVPR